MRRLTRVLVLAALLPVAAVHVPQHPASAQEETPALRAPTMEEMFDLEPLLTTGLADARTGVPFLDDFDPLGAARLTLLPRGPDEGFSLARPGLFEQRLQSYCLQSGAYGPGGGDGFLYAPVAGPQADLFRSVMRNAAKQPEIPQKEVQSLLWDMLAGLTPNEMQAGVAQRLLNPEQLNRLVAVARQRREAFEAKMPEMTDRLSQASGSEAGQRMLELTQKMATFGQRMQQAAMAGDQQALQRIAAEMEPLSQQMAEVQGSFLEELLGVNLSFEERESQAVLEGEHEPGAGSREVPEGRWSYHPDGFLVRYFSKSYRQTRVQAYVASGFDVRRDESGRITSIADQRGSRIDIEYDGGIEPATIPGDPAVQAHAFGSVRCHRRAVFGPEMWLNFPAEWEGAGWALSGVPSGAGGAGNAAGRFADLNERYQWAKAHAEEVSSLAEAVDELRGELGTAPRTGVPGQPDVALSDVIDLGSLTLAMQELAGAAQAGPLSGPVSLCQEAWISALCQYTGGWLPEGPGGPEGRPSDSPGRSSSDPGQESGDAPEFDPSDGVAVPGDTSEQRLGMGPTDPDSDKEKDCEAAQYELAVAKALHDAFDQLQPEPGESVDSYNSRVAQKALEDIQGQVESGDLNQTPGKPKAPMGTHPTDLRIAPGGARDDPAYADDWAAYDSMSPEQFEQYIKNEYFSNDPEAAWEACRAHEQDHIDLGNEEVQRAKARGDDNWQNAFEEWVENPWLLRDAERRAYKKQMEELKRWIDENC